jgi:hypothetical protein
VGGWRRHKSLEDDERVGRVGGGESAVLKSENKGNFLARNGQL